MHEPARRKSRRQERRLYKKGPVQESSREEGKHAPCTSGSKSDLGHKYRRGKQTQLRREKEKPRVQQADEFQAGKWRRRQCREHKTHWKSGNNAHTRRAEAKTPENRSAHAMNKETRKTTTGDIDAQKIHGRGVQCRKPQPTE